MLLGQPALPAQISFVDGLKIRVFDIFNEPALENLGGFLGEILFPAVATPALLLAVAFFGGRLGVGPGVEAAPVRPELAVGVPSQLVMGLL